jgi:phospholipid/cholesterol/gamma-HCH transport system ATP-binding protein
MGVLFQDGALLGSLTLGENVALPLREHTKLSAQDIRAIVLHKLSLVNLEEFTDYYPSELSGGMRKRAGLARAMVTDPPILLCDEPTSGLDPINAAQMDALLLSLKERFPDMTIVSVSHDMESVRVIADHVIVLAEKTVAYCGTLDTLQKTTDPYLRQFLDRKPLEDDRHADEHIDILDPATQQRMDEALDSWLRSS